MPLESGNTRKVISKNISEMVAGGHPQKQAVAASLHNADIAKDAEKGNPNHASNGQFASGGGSGGKSTRAREASDIPDEDVNHSKLASKIDAREAARKQPAAQKPHLEKFELKGRPGEFVVQNNQAGGRAIHHLPVSSEEADSMIEKENAKFAPKEKSSTPSENTPRAIKERKEAAKRGQLHFEGGVAKEEKAGTWKPTDVEKSGKDELPEWKGRNLDKNPVGDKYPSAPSADCGSAAVWPGRTLD